MLSYFGSQPSLVTALFSHVVDLNSLPAKENFDPAFLKPRLLVECSVYGYYDFYTNKSRTKGYSEHNLERMYF